MKRPFVYIFFSILIGIIITNLIELNMFRISVILLISFSLLLLFTREYDKIIICILFVVIGGMLLSYSLRESLLNSIDSTATIEVIILSEGIEKGRFTSYMEYEARLKDLRERSLVRVYNQENSIYNVGDIIEIRNFKHIDLNLEEVEGYYLYLKSRGIRNIIDVNFRDVRYVKTQGNLRSISYRTRRKIEEYFDRSFEPTEGSLLKSIIFGNRGYMSREMIESFSRSGTAHIIAVSGLHIGLIVIFLEKALSLLELRKGYIRIINILVLILYAYAVNFPVSIVRASMMYYLYAGAFFLERKYDAINTLMLIGTFLLIFNPFIIFSVSFQLSFSATLGILTLYPIIYKTFIGIIPKVIRPILAVTIAAQISTLPILIYHFNYLSTISIVANLLIVPVMGFIISLTLGSIFFSAIPLISVPLNFIISILLKYVYRTAEICSNSFYSGINIEFFKMSHVLIYYIVIVFIYLRLRSKKRLSPLEEKYEL